MTNIIYLGNKERSSTRLTSIQQRRIQCNKVRYRAHPSHKAMMGG